MPYKGINNSPGSFGFNPLSLSRKNSDLYVYELREALNEIDFKPNILIFDSCFMVDFETALELRNSAVYLLGAQGFDSRAVMGNQLFLKHLIDNNGNISDEDLATHIVNNIRERLRRESPEAPTVSSSPDTPEEEIPDPKVPDWFFDEYCYSCIDLGRMEDVNNRINAVLDLIASGEIERAAVRNARRGCHAFYVTELPDIFYIGTVDLNHFLEKLRENVDNRLKRTVTNCIAALSEAIVKSNAGSVLTTPSTPATPGTIRMGSLFSFPATGVLTLKVPYC